MSITPMHEREWAYDRQSHIGKLDKGLDEAKAKGWTVVSMKDDWAQIYPKLVHVMLNEPAIAREASGDRLDRLAVIGIYA